MASRTRALGELCGKHPSARRHHADHGAARAKRLLSDHRGEEDGVTTRQAGLDNPAMVIGDESDSPHWHLQRQDLNPIEEAEGYGS
ncbi:MAG: hypothetical protein ACLR4Z_17055 [Butyricicoccaceae bacterium]